MNYEKLTGGAAVGAALVVWVTHGSTFAVEEIAIMAAGAGAAVTYLVGLAEEFIGRSGGDRP